jgi:hypothetical protein
MEEPSPTSPDRTELVDSSSKSQSLNSVGKRTAKLTLWSPFAGIFLLALFAGIFGNRDDFGPTSMIAVYGFSSLFFAGGLGLGIRALRRMKIEGRNGIFGRALTGMVLDGLLLCLTLYLMGFFIYVLDLKAKVKNQEASQAQNLKEMIALRDAATADFGLKVKEWGQKYQSASATLMKAKVLNMASVKSREDLKDREEMVGEFVAASKKMQELAERGTELYERELQKRNLTRRFREASVKAFAKTFSIKANSKHNLASRQAEVRLGEVMLKVLTFLDEAWGQWTYLSTTQQLEFKNDTTKDEYSAAAKELKQAVEESNKLNQQIPQAEVGK